MNNHSNEEAMNSNHSIDVEAETRAAIKFAETHFRNEDEFTERDLTMVQAGWLAAKRSIAAAPVCQECRDRPRFKGNWLDMYHAAPEVSAQPVPLASGNTNNESDNLIHQSQMIDEWGVESGWVTYTPEQIEALKKEPQGWGYRTVYRTIPATTETPCKKN